MKNILVALFLISSSLLFSQLDPPTSSSSAERWESYQQRKKLEANSLVNAIEFRSVGPSVFSGRVADIDVRPDDPTHFYVAYASGGLWKTENNGMTFTPIFEQEAVMTIGDIAVDWAKNTIWVGTGEVNSSRSSYAGLGVFKSSDGGKTWENKGLEETQHIGRIITHPTDPNTLWVAALGHLYSPNKERGVYKTTDGGDSWQKTLFVDDNTGAIDLIIDPTNPQVLYAATWERERRAWNFVESGPGSGIYKSIDGGTSWAKLSTEKSGFPIGEGAGRIGLDIVRHNGKTILYAAIDNYYRRPKKTDEDTDILAKEGLRTMSKTVFLELAPYRIEDYLRKYNFPKKYTAEKVKGMIEADEIEPLDLVKYTEDANSLLFDTPVIGLEVYKSEDEGKSWVKTHKDYLDGVYNSYGYYFGQIRVAPYDPNKIFVLGVPILKSDDGGQSFKSVFQENVHADHHALWLNPEREGHLILGNDGGINISYDDGETYNKCNTPPVGQFYYIAADMNTPYQVYGGLQDNGVWKGPSTYKASNRWQSSGQYPYRSILGGDGMQVFVDTRDNATVYTGFQFGNYFRIAPSGKLTSITPKHDLGQAPYRWNWQAPIHLSVHNQDILYMGSNLLHRSLNQGNDFETISDDLTQGGLKGDVPFGTLATIHESPLQFGLIYTGSDDGLVYITKDGGVNWDNISAGLPKNMWVSRIQASKFKEGKVYVVLNGYRWDNFSSMLYQSEDYGRTWEKLGLNLPMEALNVVKEDPENPNILYVGSDHGLYVSLDGGQDFMLLNNQLPAVPVHDVVIHPREKELIVGTHGRSIYIGSVKELQQLTPEVLNKSLFTFNIDDIPYRSNWGNNSFFWREASVPEVKLPVYLNDSGDVTVTILTEEGMELKTFDAKGNKGLNFLTYDLSIEESVLEDYLKSLNKNKEENARPIKVKKAKNGILYLYKGIYKVQIEKGKDQVETKLNIK